jgi:hypothetical protein
MICDYNTDSKARLSSSEGSSLEYRNKAVSIKDVSSKRYQARVFYTMRTTAKPEIGPCSKRLIRTQWKVGRYTLMAASASSC